MQLKMQSMNFLILLQIHLMELQKHLKMQLIHVLSNLQVHSLGVAHVTQNAIDEPSDLAVSHLMELFMQLKMQLMHILI
jgi:hypothetical protein